jgi:2-oxo-4-hydroxy-4-carboxy-5-ureidoimidazoline decarboxylase
VAPTVDQIDALPADRAAELFSACCGATRWVSGMVARRPFGSARALLDAADDIWQTMDERDIREAFAHHPRIGETTSPSPQTERAASWSGGEQSRVGGAAAALREALARANREYEARFGYIYIVCATGKTAEELLASATERLRHTPDDELRVAAEEQRKITRLRLEKLLDDSHGRHCK